MTASDKKIVAANPALNAYQLFTEKGLSKKGYDEMLNSNPVLVPDVQAPPSNLLVPDMVIQSNKHNIQPALSQHKAPAYMQGGETVRLKNEITGKEFTVSAFAANRMLRKHGTEFTKL